MPLMQGYELWMSPCFSGFFGDSGCFDRCVQAKELLEYHGPLDRLREGDRYRFTFPTQPAGQVIQGQGVLFDHEHVQYVTGACMIGDAGFNVRRA
jgi:hypothetical protein